MYTAEGTLTAWRKPSGALVENGEVVLEIETEKAVQEVGAPASGVLHHVLQEGARLQVESLIGYVLAVGETPPNAIDVRMPAAPDAKAGVAASDLGHVSSKLEQPIHASPIAKRLSREHNIDLATLRGSGPGGRIVEADVYAELKRQAPSSAVGKSPAAQRTPLSRMRRGISERLRRSVDTAVSLTLTREVRAEGVVACRVAAAKATGEAVPYDALFVKILALALRQLPTLNATIEGSDLVLFSEVNVGFAVAIDEGLLVPVIRGADSLTLAEIATLVRELTAKAREGRLTPDDTAGGTATITNLGAYAIDAFTPVLNPPQAVVLGIGRIQPKPVIEGGAVVTGTVVVLSLTFDHRVSDGAAAARLLDRVAEMVSNAGEMIGETF
jgi:pyruvate dehydrogenase E2 component (dihydrolipoamide acetyltransferase)